MIKVVSWNINKQNDPWDVLEKMGKDGEADVALLQETGNPPTAKEWPLQKEEELFWDKGLFDRRCRVVALNKRVKVEHFSQIPPGIGTGPNEIGVSGIGTIAVARVIPVGAQAEPFIAISMYARWTGIHPLSGGDWIVSDASAHRILSDLSALI